MQRKCQWYSVTHSMVPLAVLARKMTGELVVQWRQCGLILQSLGSTHGDEVKYVLCDPLGGNTVKNYTDDDKLVSRAIATMWSNFAKSGNPNRPEDVTKYIHTTWPEYLMSSQEYFEIKHQMSIFSVKNHFHARKMALWSELIPTSTS